MTKKRSIVSYDKLSSEQKTALNEAFPDGYSEGMTQIKTPTGETLDALLWDTEEIIYLVKLNKPVTKVAYDEDDEEEEDDFEAIDDDAAKADGILEDEDDSDDDVDSFDDADDADDEEEDEDEE